jgi:hypothetical protein
MQDQGIAGEFRHLVEVDECSFQQLLLTEIHFHFTLSRLGFRGKVTRRTNPVGGQRVRRFRQEIVI